MDERFGFHSVIVLLLFGIAAGVRNCYLILKTAYSEKRRKETWKIKVLKSLISGILLCGILFQAVFVWFSDAKVFFSLGLWIGVGVAVFMAWHIRYSLEDALDMSEGDAPKHMYRMYGIRMAVVLVVFFITAYFEIGSMIGVLLGVMTLKVGAYMQPLLQKIKKKRR